jgi:hypothetical protein
VIALAEKTFSREEPMVRLIFGIGGWLRDHEGEQFDRVTVSIGVSQGKRTPAMARKFLREETEGKKAVWEKYAYAFDFREGRYAWKKKPIHVTAGEAWFLYRWLVMGRGATANAFEIQHLRKRLGPGFLRELTGRRGNGA